MKKVILMTWLYAEVFEHLTILEIKKQYQNFVEFLQSLYILQLDFTQNQFQFMTQLLNLR